MLLAFAGWQRISGALTGIPGGWRHSVLVICRRDHAAAAVANAWKSPIMRNS